MDECMNGWMDGWMDRHNGSTTAGYLLTWAARCL